MTAMGQGTETCADRPTEVSVIRFVSRNRTIEEIAPKKVRDAPERIIITSRVQRTRLKTIYTRETRNVCAVYIVYIEVEGLAKLRNVLQSL